MCLLKAKPYEEIHGLVARPPLPLPGQRQLTDSSYPFPIVCHNRLNLGASHPIDPKAPYSRYLSGLLITRLTDFCEQREVGIQLTLFVQSLVKIETRIIWARSSRRRTFTCGRSLLRYLRVRCRPWLAITTPL